MKRGAFTLLEVLIAIVVIVVLVGILMLGMGRIMGSSKATQTGVSLQNLESILAAVQPPLTSRQPPLFWKNGASVAPADREFGYSVAKAPQGGIDPSAIATTDVMRNTGILLTFAQLNPQNREHIQKIGTTVATSRWSKTASYSAGAMVAYSPEATPTALRFYKASASAGAGVEPPAAPWVEVLSAPLDAWGNPVLFVPAGGLADVTVAGQPNKTITSAGTIDNGGTMPISARPFFVSAGEDGDFSKGDDNVYSFGR